MFRSASLAGALTLVFLCLSACSAPAGAGPAATVEAYLTALVQKDASGLSTRSCAEWEPEALLELDSFQTVDATLEGLACALDSEEGGTALVTCQGSIVATYNDENQSIDLSVRTYELIEQDGVWLVCGVR